MANAAWLSPVALGWCYIVTAQLTAASSVRYGFIGVLALHEAGIPLAS